MKYISTRGGGVAVSASEAVIMGIAKDGGLFVPENIPALDIPLERVADLSYNELAYEVLKLYFDDFSEQELKDCIASAYNTGFETENANPAPIKEAADSFFLELFHGRTLAFKDMALSIHPYLMRTSCKKQGINKKMVILTATSGDTGTAALAGFAGVEDTYIVVFYPEGGVSEVQYLQMATRPEENTCVVGVRGNFDDAQTGVKEIFGDKEYNQKLADKGFLLSSANSINIGRLLPQVVYYFYAYGELAKAGKIKCGDKINFTVPTGNFGNILAGYFAAEMGLPVNKLLCASNINNVLYDFFTTDTYNKNREFVLTTSPSMDILVSSNLERLLSLLGGDAGELMQKLSTTGEYTFGIKESQSENRHACSIAAEFADELEVMLAIKAAALKGYVMDTHTAVAYAAYTKYLMNNNDDTPNVIVSTASPYKFGASVLSAIDDGDYSKATPSELFAKLSEVSGTEIPRPVSGLDSREVVHTKVCDKDKMREVISNFLGV